MQYKIFSVLSLILLSSTTFAAQQLTSYDEIKNTLLSGGKVKAIIDTQYDCGDNSNKKNFSPDTIGFTFDLFIIKSKTKEILAGGNSLNPADDGPFNAAGYGVGEIGVLPNNTVTIKTYAISVPEYKTMQAYKDICKMSKSLGEPGVKFFVA